MRSIARFGGCWVLGGVIDAVAKGIRAGIRAIAIGTTTSWINHLILELSNFFTCFTFLADAVFFWDSGFKFFMYFISLSTISNVPLS